jgi:hypothetical protein
LTRPEVEAACGGIFPGSPLPGLFLVVSTEDADAVRAAQCYLLKQRQGGFMIAAPAVDLVLDFFAAQLDEGGEQLILEHRAEVAMETTRGRRLGNETILLADLPWEAVDFFTRAHPLRGALAQATRLTGFVVGGANARPVAGSALSAASRWVAGAMDESTAREYTTAEEAEDEELLPEEAPDLDGDPVPSAQAYNALLERLQRLEADLPPRPPTPAPEAGRAAGAGLFVGAEAALSPEEMEQLRGLAGTAPRRTTTGLRQGAAPQPPDPVEGVLAESMLGALPPVDMEDPLAALTPQATLTQILAAQLRQNAVLMERLASHSTDPLHRALSGTGGGSGSDGSSVKGCVAREAFVKQIGDLLRVAKVTEAAALTELGLGETYPGLMKAYNERVPWNDQKLLGHIATIAAEGWDTAHRTKNEAVQGFCARMLMFTEQVALDGGRLPMAYLLAGYPDPSPAVFAPRKRSGLKAFSRLAAPSWVAANLAFLKDLDWMETRLANTAKGKPSPTAETPPPEGEEQEASRRRRRPGRGGANAST